MRRATTRPWAALSGRRNFTSTSIDKIVARIGRTEALRGGVGEELGGEADTVAFGGGV